MPKGDTSHLIFDIGALLAEISQVFTLEAGDVVMTGTPQAYRGRSPAIS